LRHFASPDFWSHYHQLPKQVQRLADACYDQLKADLSHPSLHFKKIGRYRTVRVGLHYRALAIEIPDGLLWFWIGPWNEERGAKTA